MKVRRKANIEYEKMMETILKQENQLFEKWKKDKDSFIRDGVANEEKWKQVAVKILFLLKEVNDCSNEFDEREYLNDYIFLC